MTLSQRDQLLSQLCGQCWPYQPLLDTLNLPPTADVLDIGAGNGELLALLRERGHTGRLTGLDCVAASGVLRGDAHILPFAAHSFDVVVILRVLAHLSQPAQALAEAWRVLRPGGLLVVAANGPEHLAAFWGKKAQGEVSPLLSKFDHSVLRFPIIIDVQTAQILALGYNHSAYPSAPFTDGLELEIFYLLKESTENFY